MRKLVGRNRFRKGVLLDRTGLVLMAVGPGAASERGGSEPDRALIESGGGQAPLRKGKASGPDKTVSAWVWKCKGAARCFIDSDWSRNMFVR